MRDHVYIPVGLIKTAHNEGWLRSLAYFVKLKSLHRNNVHYNFTLRSLAVKIKCSPACLSFHLQVLEEKKIIAYHSKNISFLGLKKLQIDYGYKNIAVPVDLKCQNDILRCQIIRFNLSSQTHAIKKSGIHKCRLNIVPSTRKEKTNSSYEGLSAKGLGSLFMLSMASGSRIRGKLKKLGLISCKRMYSILYSNITLSDFNIMRNSFIIPSYSILREGNVMVEKRMSMEYIK